MSKIAAGLLPYVVEHGSIDVFLVHPGGPYFAHQDAGIWSIAKGLLDDGESHDAAARREFAEEVGVDAPDVPYIDLDEVKLKSGKVIHIFAFASTHTLKFAGSNEFELEWPRRSGTFQHFPEVDRAEWFGLEVARTKLLSGQHPFLERLAEHLGA